MGHRYWRKDRGDQVLVGVLVGPPFSHDGKRLAGGGGGYNKPAEIFLLDADAGLQVLTLREDTGMFDALAFAPRQPAPVLGRGSPRPGYRDQDVGRDAAGG